MQNILTSIRAHPLRSMRLDGWESISENWSYKDLKSNASWRVGWISFDSLFWNHGDNCLYCGLNSIDGDILYRFNPAKDNFESLGTQRWADPFDVKIHRTLLQNPEQGDFYFGTSLLHDADQQQEAPGGKLVRYDWRSDRYEILGIPMPHLYVQSIAADWKREIIYGFTYPAEFAFRFDLKTRSGRPLGYIGNSITMAQAHNGVVDKYGNFWGTYAETRAWDERPGKTPIRLFKYHPDADRIHFFEFGLSRKSEASFLVGSQEMPDREAGLPDMTECRQKEDYGYCDSMAYDGERYIYAGTVAGVLCRIDIEENRVEKIANIMPSGRCPALCFDMHGRVYAAGGMRGKTALSRFNPMTMQLEHWSKLKDSNGVSPARIHDIAVDVTGRVWLAENDNHERSSYLWEAHLGN